MTVIESGGSPKILACILLWHSVSGLLPSPQCLSPQGMTSFVLFPFSILAIAELDESAPLASPLVFSCLLHPLASLPNAATQLFVAITIQSISNCSS